MTSIGSHERHLLDCLLRHARQRPDATALLDASGQTHTWGEVAMSVHLSTKMLDGHTRVIREIHNTIDDVVWSLACLARGVLEVAIDARFPEQARREMIRRSAGATCPASPNQTSSNRFKGAKSLDDAIDHLGEFAASVCVDTANLVLWTSGTTSQPRGVMLSPRNLHSNATAKLRAVPQSTSDRRLTVLPISHAYARTCDMGTWLISGCVWKLDLGTAAIDRINSEFRPTHINCVPSIASVLLDRLESNDEHLADLQVLGCGGAAMTSDTFARFQNQGIEVVQGYGCTETSPVIFSASPGHTRAGCVGSLVDGWEIRIQEGRLFVRGQGVMLGYLDEAEATARKIDGDGWYDTGDLVEELETGLFRILGRADDVIVLDSGFKIHPQTIETKLNQLPAVEHAVLFHQEDMLTVAIQTKTLASTAANANASASQSIESELEQYLPPGTKRRIVSIEPPLSYERNELTAKGTAKRTSVVARFNSE